MTCKSWEKEEKGWNCFVLCLFLSVQCSALARRQSWGLLG